ncbi:hypothetical protein EDB80DRAFT_733880 [Ilyonectria destructans]|nr:hypothetical protein EDB80DRAFT_733880 [Ilyonectria destructans]
MADLLDKLAFVMHAAKDFKQHHPSLESEDYHPGNFECYFCFRVRGHNHFDVLQSHSRYVDTEGEVIGDRDPGLEDGLVMLRRFASTAELGVVFTCPLTA